MGEQLNSSENSVRLKSYRSDIFKETDFLNEIVRTTAGFVVRNKQLPTKTLFDVIGAIVQ